MLRLLPRLRFGGYGVGRCRWLTPDPFHSRSQPRCEQFRERAGFDSSVVLESIVAGLVSTISSGIGITVRHEGSDGGL